MAIDLDHLQKLAAGWAGTFRWAAFESGEEGLEYVSAGASADDAAADATTMVYEMDQDVVESLAELINGGKAAIPELAAARARIAALEDGLRTMLASAHPRPGPHPTMTAAWAKGRELLGQAATVTAAKTVGELLSTAQHGDVIEYRIEPMWWQVGSDGCVRWRGGAGWSEWHESITMLMKAIGCRGRRVPTGQHDANPTSRGPL